MTKEEFLNELRNGLKGLPKEDLDNRIAFYEEAINDRMDDGKSEEEAVADLGSVEDILNEIAKETPLVRLVKEKVKPKRSLRGWEIALIILGFPLWFPILLTAFILTLVGYLLIWIFVLVTYTVETALVVGGVGSLVIFFIYLSNGTFNPMFLGASMMGLGAAMLLVFGCIGITKANIALHRKIMTGIKASIMKKGRN